MLTRNEYIFKQHLSLYSTSPLSYDDDLKPLNFIYTLTNRLPIVKRVNEVLFSRTFEIYQIEKLLHDHFIKDDRIPLPQGAYTTELKLEAAFKRFLPKANKENEQFLRPTKIQALIMRQSDNEKYFTVEWKIIEGIIYEKENVSSIDRLHYYI